MLKIFKLNIQNKLVIICIFEELLTKEFIMKSVIPHMMRRENRELFVEFASTKIPKVNYNSSSIVDLFNVFVVLLKAIRDIVFCIIVIPIYLILSVIVLLITPFQYIHSCYLRIILNRDIRQAGGCFKWLQKINVV